MERPPMQLVALGAALALGLYVAFGPSGRRVKRQKHAPPGLANSGHACFVNASLQALASCPSFMSWLAERVQDHPPDEDSVREQLWQLIQILNNRSGVTDLVCWNADGLMAAIRRHGWYIDGQEQDAHEMLHILLTSLEEELQRSERAQGGTGGIGDILNQEESAEPVPEGSQTSPSPGHRRRSSGVFMKSGQEITRPNVEGQTNTLKRRKTATPFSGTLTNKVTFTDGRAKSPISALTFNNITLSLPQTSSGFFGGSASVSLETLLQMYISRETVENVIEPAPGAQPSDLAKQMAFGKLPPCLCLHIQRTAYSSQGPTKRADHVTFPEVLDMSRYVYLSQMKKDLALRQSATSVEVLSYLNPKVSDLYQLCSVLVHLGPVHSGHYVTYRRGPLGSRMARRWFYTSDSTVEEVPSTTVFKAHVFMLFYERIFSPSPT
eukprot:maker-scaffold6759_size3621-snap-gene-0.1 protein:Tk12456 transcript:maker-scaffold6759_size3621-snap-gene-0.1-mRNA-1 annotation:"ubiquitin carboxyl-terminal hydrolase 30-like"